MSAPTPAPVVSVVFTMMFPRGRVLDCIASWGKGQTLPREQIEIIVTGNGRDPELEKSVKQALGPGDQLLHLDTDNEAAMYAHSAQQARGTWLFFTEAHVVAAPDTLEKLLADVNARNLDGSCVRTLPCEDTHWACRIEARMYEDDFLILSDEKDWRKFTKRGFLVRRSAYEAVGGLDARYHRYCVMPTGARLRDRGARLGHTPDAVVTHYNATDLEETFDYAWEYRRNEQLHLRDHPDVDVGAVLSEAHPDAMLRKATRRAAWKTLRAWRPGGGQEKPLLQAFTLLKSLLPALSQRRLARLRYYGSRLRLALAGSDAEAQYHAFQKAWQCYGHLSLEELLHEDAANPAHSSAAPWLAEGTLHPGELPRHVMDGFYDAEEWQGRRFRWMSVAASVRVDVRRADLILSLDVGGLVHPRKEDVRLYWNGRPLKRLASSAGQGRLAYRIKQGYFLEKPGQILSITCAPAPVTASGDSRTLGLPIFGIGFARQPA
ncbi:MAG: glycosyltransferase family 2 protein [Roseimicrobium sp.]